MELGKAHIGLVGAAALALSCSDPLRDSKIEALGEEDPAFPATEIHRPGQPCVACHSPYGGAEPVMSVAGTLFRDPKVGELALVPEHVIRIIDSEGQIIEMTTNRCGNFFLTTEQFDPAFPLRAELRGPGEDGDIRTMRTMASRIGREGSCGDCHADPASSLSPGVVFVPDGLLLTTLELPDEGECPTPRFAPNLFDPNQPAQ